MNKWVLFLFCTQNIPINEFCAVHSVYTVWYLFNGGAVYYWQTEGEPLTAAWSTAGLSGSMRERARWMQSSRERERERKSMRGSDFFLSLSISEALSDPLWPSTSVLLASLSFYLCSTSLSLSLSHFLTTSLHPSHLAHFPITLPYSARVS